MRELPNNTTISFGLAQYVEGDTYEDLFNRADEKMYEGKGEGGNTIHS